MGGRVVRGGNARRAVRAAAVMSAVTLVLAVTVVQAGPAAAENPPEFLWAEPQVVLQFPRSLAVDGSGNLYVADTEGHRILKLAPDGSPLSSWGTQGSGNGQFVQPNDLAIDGSGNVYVADANNHRIQKFTSDGTFLTAWGSEGSGNGEFFFPRGIAVDGSGNVYVADTDNSRIQKFTSTGTFISTWGSQGSANGELKYPSGVAIDGSGNVYVADTDNNRVQTFTSTGTFLATWGTEGSANGQLQYPSRVAIDGSGDVVVADSYNHRIQRFTASGTFLGTWGSQGTGNGQFHYPHGVAVGAGGDIYVVDSNNGRIQRFTSTGTFAAIIADRFQYPFGLALDAGGNIYVADTNNSRIRKLAPDGTTLTVWGSEGSANGQFEFPQGVAVAGNGTVYVADTYNDRIQTFSSTGTFLGQWGTSGSGNGQFNTPYGVGLDGAGNVYVADTNNHRIQRFTAAGTHLDTWGSLGGAAGQFNYPTGVAVDADGTVSVADSENHRIQTFTSTGTFLAQWGGFGTIDGKFRYPSGVGVDSDGNVFVADRGNHRIQKFTSSGTHLTTWGSLGSDDGQFQTPHGVVVDGDGYVFVADTYNHRIQKFEPGHQPVYSLSVTKSADQTEVAAGQTIDLHVTLENTGEDDLTGLTVDDPNAPDCEQSLPELGSGEQHTIDCTYTTSPADIGTYTNVATVDSDQLDSVASNQVDVAVTIPVGSGLVAGAVTDSVSGDAIGGALVAALSPVDFSPVGVGITHGEGGYHLLAPPGSHYLYVVEPSGSHRSAFAGAPDLVPVTEGGTTERDVPLEPATGSIAGTTVEDGTGTPLADVLTVTFNTSAFGPGPGALTAPDGTFDVPEVGVGDHLAVFVDLSGAHRGEFYENAPAPDGATPITVQGGTTTGGIHAALEAVTPPAGGQPITGTVTRDGTSDPLEGVAVFALHASNYQLAAGDLTGPDGSYDIDLDSGSYLLEFYDTTGTHQMEWHQDVAFTQLAAAVPVAAPAVVDADLTPNVGGASGTLTQDGTGTPLAGMLVAAIDDGGRVTGVTLTAPDGTWSLSDLPARTHRIRYLDPTGAHTSSFHPNPTAFFGDATPFPIAGGQTTTGIDTTLTPT